jgi:hypothetical protein
MNDKEFADEFRKRIIAFHSAGGKRAQVAKKMEPLALEIEDAINNPGGAFNASNMPPAAAPQVGIHSYDIGCVAPYVPPGAPPPIQGDTTPISDILKAAQDALDGCTQKEIRRDDDNDKPPTNPPSGGGFVAT